MIRAEHEYDLGKHYVPLTDDNFNVLKGLLKVCIALDSHELIL